MAQLRSRLKGRSEGGTFSAWPHACHQHPNFCRLSLPARALLFEFVGQLRKANNGDLTCSFSILSNRGWRSRDTIERARKELEDAGWLLRTRQGGRNAANLYAVTWLAIEPCGGKLDVPAGPPPGTWKKPFDLTGSRATLVREAVKVSPAGGQQVPWVAQETG
jgi:hypothetical protein